MKVTVWIGGHANDGVGGTGVFIETGLEPTVIAWALDNTTPEMALLDAAMLAFQQMNDSSEIVFITSSEELVRCIESGEQFGESERQWELLDDFMADHQVEFKHVKQDARIHYVNTLARWATGGNNNRRIGPIYHGDGSDCSIKLLSPDEFEKNFKTAQEPECSTECETPAVHETPPDIQKEAPSVHENPPSVHENPPSVQKDDSYIDPEYAEKQLNLGWKVRIRDGNELVMIVFGPEEKERLKYNPRWADYSIYTIRELRMLGRLHREDWGKVHLVMRSGRGDLTDVTNGDTMESWLEEFRGTAA